MTSFRADLHCHSTCSDGTFTPAELVAHAVKIGLSGLVITDHDTTEAYPEVFQQASEAGLRMVSGAEFSSTHEQESIHVLGYSYRIDHPAIIALVEKHKQRRHNRNTAILKKLSDAGMPLAPESIENVGHTTGRPHIAKALLEKGYITSIDEAFRTYIGDGKPCHARGEPVTTAHTIESIHQAGGLAVIAHPHLIKRTHIIDSLLALPFDGIECYYARFPPRQEKRWIEIADQKGWIKTGGSDFHGAVKPDNDLGNSWVNEDTFNLLAAHYSRHS